MSGYGWIGVDLDGTLASYEGWVGPGHIGAPVGPMVERVKDWLANGQEVRIMTARVWSDGSTERNREVMENIAAIDKWCIKHIGQTLRVTCMKDFKMVELWDDRAVRVKINQGVPCCGNYEA